MIELWVSPSLPWTIGRALHASNDFKLTDKVSLIIDDTANAQFREFIEALVDTSFSFSHFEVIWWSPQNHKKHFAQNTRAFTLLLLAQQSGHPLFGPLGRDLIVDCIFSEFEREVYERYVSYTQLTDEVEDDDDEKERWLNDLFFFWTTYGLSGHKLEQMGVSACGELEKDMCGVCCKSVTCAACATFKWLAADHDVYDV